MSASLGAQASRLHSVRQHAQRIRYSSTANYSAALFSRYALTAGGMSTPAGLPRWGPARLRSQQYVLFARETKRCRKASHWALRFFGSVAFIVIESGSASAGSAFAGSAGV